MPQHIIEAASSPGTCTKIPAVSKALATQTPKFFKDLGAQRVKMAYGPFLAPASDDPTYMGMRNFTMYGKLPCSDCVITNWTPNLEFADGSSANANTGMWLHHVVFFNMNRTDVTCPYFPDRFAAAGNERSVIDYTVGGFVHSDSYRRNGKLTVRV